MNIPITDKFWCKSKFDDNFNEISYIDNCGKSFEFIDPTTNQLKYYKTPNIDISQELLNKIKNVKSDNKQERLFINFFSNLKLCSLDRSVQSLLLINNREYVVEWDISDNIYFIDYKIWSVFEKSLLNDDLIISKFFNLMFEKYFKIYNAETRNSILY